MRTTIFLCVGLASCAPFQPSLGAGPCRDPSTGRFITCPTSGGGDDALLALGLIAGLAAVAGIGYLIVSATRSSSPPPPPQPECRFPVDAVLACESRHGYRFAVPWPSADCGTGAREVGRVPLTCEAERRPAYHACVGADGWRSQVAWESCPSIRMAYAPGDFVPPGRTPTQGVAPYAVYAP